jgi:ribosomal protein L40E
MDRDIEVETLPMWSDDDLSRRYGICEACGALTDHPDTRTCRWCETEEDET